MSLLHLVKGVQQLGHEPIVIFQAPHALLDRYTQLGMDISILAVRKPIRSNRKVLRLFARAVNFAASKIHAVTRIGKIISIIKTKSIQLLHLNNSTTLGYEWLIAAKLLGIPCVTHERGWQTNSSLLSRFLARRFDAIICISAAVKENLLSRGFKSSRIEIIHNGLDIQLFKNLSLDETQVRTEFGIDSGRPIVGIVGNLQRWKGQDVVLKAMTRIRILVPNVVCLIVGDSATSFAWDVAYHESLKTLVAAEGLEKNVLLTGYRRDVASYMNAMSIVIHASIDPEPFGRVLLEAMALSKPLIATRAGGVPEIVVNELTGDLYEPGNSSELADHLLTLLTDSEKGQTMGAAGYARVVSEFNAEKTTRKTVELYRVLCPALT